MSSSPPLRPGGRVWTTSSQPSTPRQQLYRCVHLSAADAQHSIFWLSLAVAACPNDLNMSFVMQGSGWGWLGYNKESGALEIQTTSNQDPLAASKVCHRVFRTHSSACMHHVTIIGVSFGCHATCWYSGVDSCVAACMSAAATVRQLLVVALHVVGLFIL